MQDSSLKKKCQYLINKQGKVGLGHFNNCKNYFVKFIEYLNDMQDVYKNIEKYNLGKKPKVLIVFDDMIADILNNKKLYPIVTELFIRGRKFGSTFIRLNYFDLYL